MKLVEVRRDPAVSACAPRWRRGLLIDLRVPDRIWRCEVHYKTVRTAMQDPFEELEPDANPGQSSRRSRRMAGLVFRLVSLFIVVGGHLLSQNLIAAEPPIGFKTERYAQLWKRNPFWPVALVAPQTRPSPFGHLFLAS